MKVARVLTEDASVRPTDLPPGWDDLIKGVTAREAGALAYHFGLFNQAADYYRQSLQVSDDRIARFMLGKALAANNQPDAAVAEWHQLGPEVVATIARDYWKQAEEVMNQGEWQSAYDLAQIALELDPTFARAYYVQGVALAGLGATAQAVTRLQQALTLQPDTNTIGMTSLALGQAYLRLGNKQQAVTMLQSATRALPDYAHAYQVLGEAYFQQGQIEGARQAWIRVLALEPGNRQVEQALSELAR